MEEHWRTNYQKIVKLQNTVIDTSNDIQAGKDTKDPFWVLLSERNKSS